MTMRVYRTSMCAQPELVALAATHEEAIDAAADALRHAGGWRPGCIVVDAGHADYSIVELDRGDGTPTVRHSGPDAPLLEHANSDLLDQVDQLAAQATLNPGELNLLVAHLTAGRVTEPRLLAPSEVPRVFTVLSLIKRNRIDMRIDGGAVTFVNKQEHPVELRFMRDGTAKVEEHQAAL